MQFQYFILPILITISFGRVLYWYGSFRSCAESAATVGSSASDEVRGGRVFNILMVIRDIFLFCTYQGISPVYKKQAKRQPTDSVPVVIWSALDVYALHVILNLFNHVCGMTVAGCLSIVEELFKA